MSQLFSKPKVIIPEAKIPETPKPVVNKKDTGANIALGSGDVTATAQTGEAAGDATKNQRVAGRSTARRRTTYLDVLGGLGQSGLNI